jgi:hypothetical protein
VKEPFGWLIVTTLFRKMLELYRQDLGAKELGPPFQQAGRGMRGSKHDRIDWHGVRVEKKSNTGSIGKSTNLSFKFIH